MSSLQSGGVSHPLLTSLYHLSGPPSSSLSVDVATARRICDVYSS